MAESGPPEEGLEVETNWDEATPSFDLMDLKEELLRVSFTPAGPTDQRYIGHLRLRLREALRHPAARHQAHAAR